MNITDSQKIKNAQTSQNPDVLRKLAKSTNKSVLQALTINPNTPADVLASFSAHKGLYVYIAAHPNTPADILNELGKSNHQFIQEAVALNPSTSAKTLDAIVKARPMESVLMCVALNPNVSKDALINLQALSVWSQNGGLPACLALNTSPHYVEGSAFIPTENSSRIVAEHIKTLHNGNPGLHNRVVKPTSESTEDVYNSLHGTFNPPKPQNDKTQRQVVVNSAGARTQEQAPSINAWP